MKFYAAYQIGLMIACLVALAAIVITPCLALAWGKVRAFASLGKIKFALVAFVVCGFIQFGATKGGGGEYRPRISWDDGLVDAGSTISENGVVDIRWSFRGIPAASTVFIDYKPIGGGEWVNLGETTASALRFTATLANARNYQYFVYSSYIPPAPVHTNGVWVGKAYTTKDGKGFVVVQSRITAEGKVIATPEQVKKEEEK